MKRLSALSMVALLCGCPSTPPPTPTPTTAVPPSATAAATTAPSAASSASATVPFKTKTANAIEDVVVGTNGTIAVHTKTWQLWNLRTLKARTTKADAPSFNWSPDGTRFYTYSSTEPKLWNAETDAIVYEPEFSVWGASRVFTPDSKTLLIGDSNSGNIIAINTADGKTLWEKSLHVSAQATDKDFLINTDGTAAVYSVNGSGDWLDLKKGPKKASYNLRQGAFDASGKLYACDDDEGRTAIYDVATRKRRHLLGKPLPKDMWQGMRSDHTNVAAFDFSDDGKLLAAAGIDNSVRIWDVETGKLFKTIIKGQAEPDMGIQRTVAFNHDASELAYRMANESERTLKVINLKTGKTHEHACSGFEPEIRWVRSGQVLAWVDNKRLQFTGNIGRVSSQGFAAEAISWSADGRFVATTAAGDVRLTRLTDGTTIWLRAEKDAAGNATISVGQTSAGAAKKPIDEVTAFLDG